MDSYDDGAGCRYPLYHYLFLVRMVSRKTDTRGAGEHRRGMVRGASTSLLTMLCHASGMAMLFLSCCAQSAVGLDSKPQLGGFGLLAFGYLPEDIQRSDAVGFGVGRKVKDVVDERFNRHTAL